MHWSRLLFHKMYNGCNTNNDCLLHKIARNFIWCDIVTLHNSFDSYTKSSFILWHLCYAFSFSESKFPCILHIKMTNSCHIIQDWNRQGVKQTGGMWLKPDTLLHLIKGSSVSICCQIRSLSTCWHFLVQKHLLQRFLCHDMNNVYCTPV